MLADVRLKIRPRWNFQRKKSLHRATHRRYVKDTNTNNKANWLFFKWVSRFRSFRRQANGEHK
jgi:hypothetical protein